MLTHRSATDFGKARRRSPVLIDVTTKPRLLHSKYDRFLAPASIAGGASAFLTGIGIGLFIAINLFVNLPAPVDREAWLENAQRFRNEIKRSSIAPAIPATSQSFLPKFALADLKFSPPSPPERPASDTAMGVYAAATAPTVDVRTTVMGWQPVVTTSGTIKSGSGAVSLMPNDQTSRYKLVVAIQRKLKKQSCYWGRISGSWGAGTKYAMQEFINRIKATLPVKQPDYLLLMLLQANSDKSCGTCPADQTASVSGSCVPQAVFADTQHKSSSGSRNGAEVVPWERTGAPQPGSEGLLSPVGTTIITTAPLPGRMAIGGPQRQPAPSAENDNQPSSVTAIAIDPSNDISVSPPSITDAHAARPRRAVRRARAGSRKAKRSRRRHRGVQAARRRNLMLSLGGAR